MMDFSWRGKQEAVGSSEHASFGTGADTLNKEKTGKPDLSAQSQPVVAEKKDAKREATKKTGDRPQEPKPPALETSAVKLLEDRYPSFIASANESRSKMESRYVLTVLLTIITIMLAIWAVWDERYFQTDGDLVYYMGLGGGILMLITLLYAMRKRARFMKKMGKMSAWYYMHLVAGVGGPVLIILHSSFSMKALNSSVAFITMLSVVVSGIFGRYIYTRIGYQVHSRLIAIRATEQKLAESMQEYQGGAAESISKSLSALTLLVVDIPQSLFGMTGRFVALRAKAATCYVDGIRQIGVMLKHRAKEQGWDKSVFHAEFVKEKRVLREHVNALVNIGQLHFYERILGGWRIFHVPLVFILLISGSVHVFAVHWY